MENIEIISEDVGTSKTKAGNHAKWKIMNPSAREMVANIIELCNIEREKEAIIKPLSEYISRTALFTGVSEETVMNVTRKNWKPKDNEEEQKCIPKKKEVSSSHKIVLDDRDIIQIKNCIRDYHIQYCKIPSLKELLPHILDQIAIEEDDVNVLQKVLRNIGYRRKKLHSKYATFVEDPKIVACRDEYLKTIRDTRHETRNVFYVYECIINRFFRLYKTWMQKYGNNEALQDKHTYTLICVVSVNGFLKKAMLLRKTAINESSSNACGELTADIFEKWLRENLIPNLPKHSLVIMDDAPHHCAVVDKALSYYASKREMVDYLKKKKVKSNEKMRRTELHQLIMENTPKHVYIVDEILNEHQHKVMRLPPYMIDLSPSQLAMDRVQQKLYENDNPTAFNLKKLGDILDKAMNSLTQEDWQKFFDKVRSLEDDCWKKDEEFEVAYDKIIKNMKDQVDESEESSEELEVDEDL